MTTPESPYFLGIDMGTTGIRAVVFDAEAQVVAAARQDCRLYAPHAGWAEQDPDEVLAATNAVVRAAAARTAETLGVRRPPIAAISFSAILHTIIPVDHRGVALGRAIIWADTRSLPFADEIKREYDAHGLYSRTGCPVHPMYSPAKLRWYRTHQPRSSGKRARFITIKEYVQADWLGPVPVDYSLASGTGLLDLATREWDAESLATAGIGPERLASLVDTTAVVGTLPAATAERLGLAPGCPVVSGAGDGPLSTLGTGCVEPGQYTAMVATSGAVRAVADQPVTDPQGRNWCYYLAEGRWVAGCAINNAGLAVRWLRDQVLAAPPAPGEAGNPTVSADEVDRWAAAVPPGADGLIVLPFLTGERSPYWNAAARGVVFGLSLAHHRGHLVRAMLEGIGYRMRSILDALTEVAGPVSEVRAAGGFVGSPVWMQIVADVLDQPLHLPVTQEASALGAAMLAMRATGHVERFAELLQFVQVEGACSPATGERANLPPPLRPLYASLLATPGRFSGDRRFPGRRRRLLSANPGRHLRARDTFCGVVTAHSPLAQ